MEEWIIQLMQSMGEWGTVGIFLLMTAENLFPPIPSEVVRGRLPSSGSPLGLALRAVKTRAKSIL